MSALDRLKPPPDLRVFVTAGAGGIGRAIVDAFAEAGAKVAVCDVSEDALAAFSKAHPGAPALPCDVSDGAAVTQTFNEVHHTLGGLDILVNNAGIAGPTQGVDEIAADDWERTLRVNMDGQFHAAHAATPALRESEGAMINISSVAGRLGYAYRTPYAASKWGIVGFTKSLAAELGPDGVRVNAILPGIVAGPRIERVIGDRAKALGVSYAEMEQRYLANVSLRRMVSAEDIASCCLFLASPGGANISGQALSVCGNVERL